MKRLIVLVGLVFLSVITWRIGERLSADAIGMALGVLFGILAGVPVALLVLASSRRREERDDYRPQGRQQPMPGYGYPMQQPPVIVLAAPGAPQSGGYGYPQPGRPMLPPPNEMPQERHFKVVGEQEEWIEEW
ncbi:MAG: hypothetical protein R3C14_08650 [Caldilineaceae bacterium]